MKYLYIFVTSLFLTFSAISLNAQKNVSNIKIGYIDKDSVISTLPQTHVFQIELNTLKKEYQDEYERLVLKYNRKVKEYLALDKDLNKTIRNARQAEITEYELRIERYKKAYERSLDDFTKEKMNPIIADFNEAVKKVAKKESINIILDAHTPIYTDENCININDKVIKILTDKYHKK